MGCSVCGENKVIGAIYCYKCGTKFAIPMFKDYTLYLHGDDDGYYSDGIDVGLDKGLADNFSRSLYEVEINGKVNMATGEFKVDNFKIGDVVYRRNGE